MYFLVIRDARYKWWRICGEAFAVWGCSVGHLSEGCPEQLVGCPGNVLHPPPLDMQYHACIRHENISLMG